MKMVTVMVSPGVSRLAATVIPAIAKRRFHFALVRHDPIGEHAGEPAQDAHERRRPRRPVEVTGASDRAADVLLVAEDVERAEPDRPPERLLAAEEAGRHRVEVTRELVAATADDTGQLVDELLGPVPATRVDVALGVARHVVGDVDQALGQLDVGLASAGEHVLEPDHVGDDVVHGPPGAPGGPSPVAVLQARDDVHEPVHGVVHGVEARLHAHVHGAPPGTDRVDGWLAAGRC